MACIRHQRVREVQRHALEVVSSGKELGIRCASGSLGLLSVLIQPRHLLITNISHGTIVFAIQTSQLVFAMLIGALQVHQSSHQILVAEV